ncbi:hypothetical protein I4U23_014953 [Adineta vaga]|nr:hypothetical protein I4U23_014953 [Adineta vaga]
MAGVAAVTDDNKSLNTLDSFGTTDSKHSTLTNSLIESIQNLHMDASSDTNDSSDEDSDTSKSSNSKNKKEKIEWVFGEHLATAFARAIEHGCVKSRGVKETVKKIEDADIIPYDQSEESKLLRYCLNEAKEKNNPLFLLIAYTLNSSFYQTINGRMAEGSPNKVYKRLCSTWSGYYTGVLMKHPALHCYRWRGRTYRGFVTSREDAKAKYKVGVWLTNKAFQSSSKLKAVAGRFASQPRNVEDPVSVIISYDIRDERSGLDVENISKYPTEREVLMVPGCLFEVIKVEGDDKMEVEARQILTHNA